MPLTKPSVSDKARVGSGERSQRSTPNLNRNGRSNSVACVTITISRVIAQDAGYTHAMIFSRGMP